MSESSASHAPRVLIIEDDASFSSRLVRNLELDGFKAEVANGVDAGLALLASQSFDVILTDLRMPKRGGLELLDELARMSREEGEPTPPVAVLSSVDDIQTVVEAMRRGAEDYITKEAGRDEIALRLRNMLKQGKLQNEVRSLRRSLDRLADGNEIVGGSASIEELKRTISEAAPSSITVLITGETGVGKELVARAIHRGSPRAGEPFIEVNCAALPDENLFLSELFGHERGAFTGAIARKRGQFELADGGTLFLDEVGELGPMAQARLLRAVETLQFTRVGGEKPIKANCRLIFATNKNLEKEAEAGTFRRDLLYRINVCPIHVSPLRSHPEDITLLARFFIARMAGKHGLAPLTLADDALAALKSNPWPGNVRELRNVIERLAIRFAGKTVEARHLKELNFSTGEPTAVAGAMVLPEGGVDLAEVEKSLVLQALQRSDWSQRNAADLLGISVDRMNARVRKFGITHPSWRVHRGAEPEEE